MKRSFRTKLLVCFLTLGILPLLLCTLLMLNTFRVSLTSSAEEGAQNELVRLQDGLEEVLDDCAGALERLAGEKTVRAVLEGTGRGGNVYYALYAAAESLPDGVNLSLLDRQGNRLYTTGTTGDWNALPVEWGALAAAGGSGETVFRNVEDFDAGAASASLRAARAVRPEGTVMGYAVADVSAGALSDLLGDKGAAGDELVLLDRFWDPVWASPSLDQAAAAGALRQSLLKNGDPTLGEETFCCVARSERSGFYLALSRPKPVAGWVMRQLYLFAGVFLVVCAVLSAAVATRLSRQFFEPIRGLNEAMAQVEAGNLDVRVNSQSIDEMGQLAGRFDRMVARLKENLERSIRDQQDLNDARIRMMQAQLNPHFLYNTLDTMKWMGKIHRLPEVAAMSADLADILRKSISGEEFVPLEEELALLERYVEIQSIRFPGKFTFRVEADSEARRAAVPKLMLQPLVENAIVHGFEDGSTGTVTVRARVDGGELAVTVADDGQGMSEESLRRFREEGPGQSGHLGLKNVDSILRLHYGPERGLRFLPAGGRGTVIEIRLPVGGKERPGC